MTVNAIQVNNTKKESDKDSEGNSMEKMPKKSENLFQKSVITKHLSLIQRIKHQAVVKIG